MRKTVMAYSGKVSGFAQFLQGMYPQNVVLMSAYRKRKTASAKAARRIGDRKILPFILPDNTA